MLKVGREEVAALIAALEDFVKRDHAAEEARDDAVAAEIADGLREVRGAPISKLDAPRPQVVVTFPGDGGPARAAAVTRKLREGSPRIFCADAWVHQGILTLQPSTLRDDEVAVLVERVLAECESEGQDG